MERAMTAELPVQGITLADLFSFRELNGAAYFQKPHK